MFWECGECGARVTRERPPVVCRECGRAGARFVESEPPLDGLTDDSLRAAWVRAGVEGWAFPFGAGTGWA